MEKRQSQKTVSYKININITRITQFSKNIHGQSRLKVIMDT